jgi:copper chaperone CopZ
MKRALILVAAIFSLLAPSVASAEKISISVKGMVCSFCAQGIKKTFMRKEGVESVDVDLDKKLVTITTKQGVTLTDADVSETVVDSGYEVIKIERAA